MVDLVLLNGPPASGKSTIAAELVAQRPLSLNLEVDIVRGLLGRWLDHAAEAGRAARRLALVLAHTHLTGGHDVVVPQFLASEEFADELGRVARDCHARFVEIALVVDREDGMARFASRRSHPDAVALAERLGPNSIATMYDDYERFLGDRHAAVRVAVLTGDVGATVRRVEMAIGWSLE